MASKVHPLARFAFSKSGSSGLYDRARPSYPSTALGLIASRLPPSANVVELGAGTGIFTRAFLSAHSEKVGKWLAVEPAEGMRKGFMDAVGRSGLLDKVNLECAEGEFAKIPVPDASADLIVIAQAFHWVGKDGGPAIGEFARVLKKGGTLALIWNLEDRDGPAKWVGKLRDAYEPHEVGTPQYRLGWWKHIFDTTQYKDNFSPLTPNDKGEVAPKTETRNLEMTLEGVIDRVVSKSYITVLEDKDKEVLIKKITETVQEGDGLVWIDKEKGTFEFPYSTDTWLFERN